MTDPTQDQSHSPRLLVAGKPITEAAKDVARFPLFLLGILTSLIYYTLTEIETFFLVGVCVMVGVIYGWEKGVLTYFVGYFLMRLGGGYVSIIASKMHFLALVIKESSNPNND